MLQPAACAFPVASPALARINPGLSSRHAGPPRPSNAVQFAAVPVNPASAPRTAA